MDVEGLAREVEDGANMSMGGGGAAGGSAALEATALLPIRLSRSFHEGPPLST